MFCPLDSFNAADTDGGGGGSGGDDDWISFSLSLIPNASLSSRER